MTDNVVCPVCGHDDAGETYQERPFWLIWRNNPPVTKVRCGLDADPGLFGDTEWCDCGNPIHANRERVQI